MTRQIDNAAKTSPLANGKRPSLSKRRDPDTGKVVAWSDEVKQWWRDVWQSSMATELTRADVHGLLMLAELLEQYRQHPTPQLAAEIRLQRQCFGLTPIDR